MFNITYVDAGNAMVYNRDVTGSGQWGAEWLIKVLSPGAIILEVNEM